MNGKEKKSEMQSSNRILWLDTLRGLACLIVFFAHVIARFPETVDYSYGVGKIGVWFFMVSGGYLLLMSGKTEKIGIGWILRFYVKKIVKIYPCLIIGVLLTWYAGLMESSDIIKNLLLIKGSAHLWFIPVIIKFYLIAPLFIVFDRIVKNDLVKAVSFLGLGTVAAIVWPFTKYPENSIELRWYIPVFMMGIIIYYISKHIKNEDGKLRILGDMLAVGAAIGIIMLTPLVRLKLLGLDNPWFLQNKYIFLGLLWSVMIIGILMGRVVKKLLEMIKPLQMLSVISYPVYIFHYPVIFLLIWLFEPSVVLLFIEAFVATLIISVIYNFIFGLVVRLVKKDGDH